MSGAEGVPMKGSLRPEEMLMDQMPNGPSYRTTPTCGFTSRGPLSSMTTQVDPPSGETRKVDAALTESSPLARMPQARIDVVSIIICNTQSVRAHTIEFLIPSML